LEVKEPSAKYLARPRYKQTELGAFPEEWTLANLGTLSAFITKGSTPTTYGFSWQQDGILFLRSECVSENGLDLSQSMFISEAAHASLRRSEIKDGDLLITITGNVGRVVVFKNSAGANINQHIARVRIVAPGVDRDFVYHFLSLPQYRTRLTSITTGQAYPQISLKQVREAPIPLPPTKTEQEAIAKALSDADSLIESLEQLLAKKRQLKQGTMQKLLHPKKGDVVRALGEVSSLKGRIGWQGLKQTEFTTNGDEPFLITGMNFKDGAIRWGEVYHISEARYAIAPEIQLRPNDVLMTKDGTIGKVLYIDAIPYPGKASLNSHLLLFRPIAASYNP
jgi:type I restriction enzyme S subunit